MKASAPKRRWQFVAIRWVAFLIAATMVVLLARPAMVQVGQFGDGRPVVEPYPSVLLIRLAIVLFSVAMFVYDAFMAFRR
jgi:hypothetical protein